jgi:Predicted transcription factor, homolog of eukaryotic MBF1
MEKKKKKEEEKALKVANIIKVLRTKKGYSYENMSDDLEITPSAYRKIETGETKLSVERLFKIAEILDESVLSFLEETENIFNQTNNDNSIGNQYQQKIENFYQENKDVYEKLIASKDDQISLLENLLETKFGYNKRQ